MKRKFHITLLEHEDGVSVSCPELPGCHSQGANVEEALENIEDAIRGYIDLYGEPDARCEIRELEIATASNDGRKRQWQWSHIGIFNIALAIFTRGNSIARCRTHFASRLIRRSY